MSHTPGRPTIAGGGEALRVSPLPTADSATPNMPREIQGHGPIAAFEREIRRCCSPDCKIRPDAGPAATVNHWHE